MKATVGAKAKAKTAVAMTVGAMAAARRTQPGRGDDFREREGERGGGFRKGEGDRKGDDRETVPAEYPSRPAGSGGTSEQTR